MLRIEREVEPNSEGDRPYYEVYRCPNCLAEIAEHMKIRCPIAEADEA